MAIRQGGRRGLATRGRGSTYQCLWLLDVLMAEKELSVEVAKVDRVKVDNMNFTEAGKDEIFE